MNDTVTSTAGAVAAGAGTYVLASLGLEPAPLFWALVGSVIGMSFAGATSRVRAIAVFVSVVLSCSLAGAWVAQHWWAGEAMSRNLFAWALAIAFHPALNAVITRLPAALDGLMRKLGIGSQP